MSTDRIIQSLKQKIASFDDKAISQEIGNVLETGDGIARISGLSGCKSSEMLSFESGAFGIALNLEQDVVAAVILSGGEKVKEGDVVTRTNKILSLSVGEGIIGRIVNPLAEPIDGKGPIEKKAEYPIERVASGVITREPVSVPLETGIKAIDATIPIGRGQRQLIIGDRQTGKSAIAIDTIINQKGKNIICIYAAIGQKQAGVARIVAKLEEAGAMEYSVVVSVGASESAALSYLAPYSATAIAEYFMDQGKDVLVVYDDLSKHAVAYREMSLLLRRPPGREAYPGDVFYLHSRLLERSCRLSKEYGGGSITALPIIETQAGDISAYIPTNVISITDGQIFLESSLFYKGIRPAINMGISVSRVGSAAQRKSMKKVAGRTKLDLAQFRELEAFAQFASDLDEETKSRIDRGERITELFKQEQYKPVRSALQVIAMYAISNGYLDSLPKKEIRNWEEKMSQFYTNTYSSLLEEIENGWSDEIEQKIKDSLSMLN